MRLLRMLFFCVLSLVVLVPASPAAQRRNAIVEAVAKAGPAVVNIRTEQIVRGASSPFGFSDPLFREFFRNLVPPRTYTTQSLGSGVIFAAEGLVLTNAHVIDKASRIFVALPDSERERAATLVGKAGYIDLAVLRITVDKDEEAGFPHIPLATSNDLLLGETVIAIGNPLGLGHSITTGIISADKRRVPMEDKIFSVFIQTDALINPGNSGGPLLNINGELIGINTAIASQAQGIGFAIPIDAVRRVLPDLIKRGSLRKPFHGMLPLQVGAEFEAAHGGVLVGGVEPGSPADRAGIRFGDVVTALDGIPVGSPPELQAMLQTYIPGNRVRLTVLRGFMAQEVELELGEFPADYAFSYGRQRFGLTVADDRRGLVVAQASGPAAAAGIRAGDFVTEIGGHAVSNRQQYARVVEAHIGFEPLRFLVIRGQRGYYVELP